MSNKPPPKHLPQAGRAGPAKKRKPARYHHGDLRRSLLDAALRVVANQGVEAVKLNVLAKGLRVSVAAPFRHFPTKEALLVALAEEGANLMVQRLAQAAAREVDPLEAQRARGVAYVRFAVDKPGYFRLLVRPEILNASEHLRHLTASSEALMEPILGRRHRGQASAELAKRSAGVLAAQALTYGLARMIVDGLLGEVNAADAERLAYELTGVLGEGLIASDARSLG
ncbi:MAG: TetR/AcrR family transcriptional regulator [Myxococcales bacterium]|nr:TetR/AcrR family transcriptional regulator [Myxococcales bacterium]